MINAICSELFLRQNEAKGSTLQTIYLGGGTPTVLSFDELQQLFNTIHRYYNVSATAEITIEANPDDFFNIFK